ncbi:class I SAM-dependent DNA methyltransferase [Lactobacillus taiwanensis]|uniref:class I SAM-dependent DNA methyltransferase n=1 Tax=Lactobacillus taiwanensis TaxID=508451 RepID=UPI00070FD2F9|nr:class I SAM-dependent methyltransferase [Lactobacillus taiwanensis]
MIYQTFAQLYDQLFDSDMYKNWEKFTLANIKKVDCNLLDLAGGSGRLAILLANDGLNVTVADFSDEMLSLASQRSIENNVSMQLIEIDMRDLSGLEKYDVITCYADSLCYLDDENDLLQVFSEVANHLEKDGVFLFDVITPHQTDDVYPGFMYNYQDDDYSRAFMWQSYADDDVEHGVIHDLTFFNRMEDGKYNRLSETHYERSYELPVIKSMLTQAGFTSIEVGSDFSLEMKDKNATRWFFKCQK